MVVDGGGVCLVVSCCLWFLLVVLEGVMVVDDCGYYFLNVTW